MNHGQRARGKGLAWTWPARRCLALIASAGLMAAGLSAAVTTAVQAAVGEQAGPFWPGNLLSMNNADFENGPGDWNSISNVSALTTSTNAFLHDHSLHIVAAGPGTSIIQLTGTSGIKIPVDGGKTYRVGAYIQEDATAGQTTEFDLGCYGPSGWIGWVDGSARANNSNGTWQWVEDDIKVPAGCTHVQGSPRVKFASLQARGDVYMDEVWFAPERAALMIGAFAPDGPAWDTDNASIGPLQSDKVFFGGSSPALPGQWNDPTNKCYEIMQQGDAPAEPPACVINLNPPSGSVYSEKQIKDFLTGKPASAGPEDQTLIMVYHGEAENDKFPKCPGATGTGNAANFKCYFEEEANNIRAAADADNLTENVFTADDSASIEYATGGTGIGCHWIVQPSYADFYFEDHYERGWADGSNLSVQSGMGDPGYSGQGTQQWNNWLNCINEKGGGKPIGLAEYGLCSQGADCNKGSMNCDDSAGEPGGSTALDEQTMGADKTYLAGEPSGDSPTLLWEYWYDNCWQFDNTNGMITEWHSIENQNGGAVGG